MLSVAEGESRRRQLLWNGKPLNSWALLARVNPEEYSVRVDDASDANALADVQLIPDNLRIVNEIDILKMPDGVPPWIARVSVVYLDGSTTVTRQPDQLVVGALIDLRTALGSRDRRPDDLVILDALLGERSVVTLRQWHVDDDYSAVEVLLVGAPPTLREAFTVVEHTFCRVFAAALHKVGAQAHSITYSFEIDPHYKTAVEQYLLYFVDFLRDLGVDASVRLHHEERFSLFAVTPRNSRHALELIREALNEYLTFAQAELSTGSVGADENAIISRLVANIYHLRGQLQLARSQIALQAATIQLQQSTINVVTRAFPATARVASSDHENIGRFFSVVPYESKGLRINLPEVVRRLKRLFGGK